MSLLSVEDFEVIVQTGMDESALQSVIDREEAELAFLLGGPLAGSRVQTFRPHDPRAPIYLARFCDEFEEVSDGDVVVDEDDVHLSPYAGTFTRHHGWIHREISVTYTPNDSARLRRALIELVRDVVVPDRDREAGTARDDRDRLAASRRKRLVRSLTPGITSTSVAVSAAPLTVR